MARGNQSSHVLGVPRVYDVEVVGESCRPMRRCGEIVAGGRYEDLEPRSIHLTMFGIDCLCIGLDALIANKRAVGRPKDLETIAELEVLAEVAKKR